MLIGHEKDCSGAVPNSVVMIDRGLESFVDAVKACQDQGAVAVIVRNVHSTGGGENDLVVMGATQKETGITVPSIFVSRKTGDELDAMLAVNPTVLVELFAADDVNSIMAYLAYLIMSVETLFFITILFSIALFAASKRNKRRCTRCRRNDELGERQEAILIFENSSRSLLEPLNGSSGENLNDPESKPAPKQDSNSSAIQSYPVVYANANGGNVRQEQLVNLRVDPKNEDILFEQQEQ